jgi:hypothetical protein
MGRLKINKSRVLAVMIFVALLGGAGWTTTATTEATLLSEPQNNATPIAALQTVTIETPAQLETVTIEALAKPDAATTASPDINVNDDRTGGWAIKQYGTGDQELPGNYYALAANGTSTGFSFWDETPARYGFDRSRADAIAANIQARWIAEQLSGIDVDLEDFPLGPISGGDSAGLLHTITYLDIATGGAFVGDVNVAATGAVGQFGPATFESVGSVNGKFRAATDANVDVMFTTAVGDDMTNLVGYRNKGISARDTPSEKRHWDEYFQWGVQLASSDTMMTVQVSYLGDVTSFFCGVGSVLACEWTELLDTKELDWLELPAGLHESAIADILGVDYSLF